MSRVAPPSKKKNGHRKRDLSALELCAGGGGAALGLEQAGFEHAALLDNDAHACATLRHNRPYWNVIEADIIIPSISQEPDPSGLPEDHGLNIDSRWNSFVVDEETMQTSLPGVYAAGDAVTGPQTVVMAIAAAKKAAEAIDKYVCGRDSRADLDAYLERCDREDDLIATLARELELRNAALRN